MPRLDRWGLPDAYTVDSRLVQNIEGVCGTLGIDLPAEKIVEALGKGIHPALPLPRLLGSSKYPIAGWDVAKILIHPEEGSYRIDLCWEKEKTGRWILVPKSLMQDVESRHHYSAIWITRDKDVSKECPNYDVVDWRGWHLILGSSIVPELLDVLGMDQQFARWLFMLLKFGEIPSEHQPLLRQQLYAAKGKAGEDLLSRLSLPFERRFGASSGTRRSFGRLLQES